MKRFLCHSMDVLFASCHSETVIVLTKSSQTLASNSHHTLPLAISTEMFTTRSARPENEATPSESAGFAGFAEHPLPLAKAVLP